MSEGWILLIILVVVFVVGSVCFWYALWRYGEMANDIWKRDRKDKYNEDADREFERMNGWR